MSTNDNERDTHFAEFAEIVVKELDENDLIPDSHARLIIKDRMEKIIARRAYDLAIYLFASVNPIAMQYSNSDEDIVNSIADMTSFPE